jgi:hypothetical protein
MPQRRVEKSPATVTSGQSPEGDESARPSAKEPAARTAPAEWTPRAIRQLFLRRLDRIYLCEVDFELDVNPRPTGNTLGGYYKSRRLVRIYSHDRVSGLRPLNELFDTFLHEVAHHLEYTEPHSFTTGGCRRRPGLMHSRVFWRILGVLKQRWADLLASRPV